jgi:tetratricopeptide (TPR) repeat protein
MMENVAHLDAHKFETTTSKVPSEQTQSLINSGKTTMSIASCYQQLNQKNLSAELYATKSINLGVELYENGHLQEAVVAFADALAVTKHIEYWDEIESDGDSSTNFPPFQPSFGKTERWVTSTNDLFIFLNPIRLPQELPKTKRRKSLSLISLFNLAICSHRSGILHNMDTGLLRKALQMYELAYAIQMEEGIDMTLTPTMIIMSNVGHIHKILGNKDNSMQCFQHLLSTIMFLVEAGEKDHIFEFDGFFENILKTVYAHPPAAAA